MYRRYILEIQGRCNTEILDENPKHGSNSSSRHSSAGSRRVTSPGLEQEVDILQNDERADKDSKPGSRKSSAGSNRRTSSSSQVVVTLQEENQPGSKPNSRKSSAGSDRLRRDDQEKPGSGRGTPKDGSRPSSRKSSAGSRRSEKKETETSNDVEENKEEKHDSKPNSRKSSAGSHKSDKEKPETKAEEDDKTEESKNADGATNKPDSKTGSRTSSAGSTKKDGAENEKKDGNSAPNSRGSSAGSKKKEDEIKERLEEGSDGNKEEKETSRPTSRQSGGSRRNSNKENDDKVEDENKKDDNDKDPQPDSGRGSRASVTKEEDNAVPKLEDDGETKEEKPEDKEEQKDAQQETKADEAEDEYLTKEETEALLIERISLKGEKAQRFIELASDDQTGRVSKAKIDRIFENIVDVRDDLINDFLTLDKDQNYVVSKDDAYDIITKHFPGFPETTRRAVVDNYDQGNDGLVHWQEMAEFYVILLIKKDGMMERFEELDKDKNGLLNKDELYQCLMNELSLWEVEARCLVDDFDTNSDGVINKTEFIEMWSQLFG